jgi:hypothetical protein
MIFYFTSKGLNLKVYGNEGGGMKDFLLGVFGLFILVTFGYLSYIIISRFGVYLSSIDPTIGTAIIAGGTTIISSVFISSYNNRKAKERSAIEAHRERKVAVYIEFLKVIVDIMNSSKKGVGFSEKKIESFFYNFTSKIMIYGSPDVVLTYSNWRSSTVQGDNKERALLLLDDLFRAIRSDVGESNSGIEKKLLLGLFIIGGIDELNRFENND